MSSEQDNFLHDDRFDSAGASLTEAELREREESKRKIYREMADRQIDEVIATMLTFSRLDERQTILIHIDGEESSDTFKDCNATADDPISTLPDELK